MPTALNFNLRANKFDLPSRVCPLPKAPITLQSRFAYFLSRQRNDQRSRHARAASRLTLLSLLESRDQNVGVKFGVQRRSVHFDPDCISLEIVIE